MKKEELEGFRKDLLALRERLVGNMRYLSEAARSQSEENGATRGGAPIHPAESGSDSYEQEFTMSLMENENRSLEMVEHALKRIDDGSYGTCEACGERIPKARLKAIPFTSLCVKCAEADEKGEE